MWEWTWKVRIEIGGVEGKGALSQVYQLEASGVQEIRDLGYVVADAVEDHWIADMTLDAERKADTGAAVQDFEVSVDFVEMGIGYYSFQMLEFACMVTGRSVKRMTRRESVNHFVEELE